MPAEHSERVGVGSLRAPRDIVNPPTMVAPAWAAAPPSRRRPEQRPEHRPPPPGRQPAIREQQDTRENTGQTEYDMPPTPPARRATGSDPGGRRQPQQRVLFRHHGGRQRSPTRRAAPSQWRCAERGCQITSTARRQYTTTATAHEDRKWRSRVPAVMAASSPSSTSAVTSASAVNPASNQVPRVPGADRYASRTQRYARTVPGTLPLSTEPSAQIPVTPGLRRPVLCHASRRAPPMAVVVAPCATRRRWRVFEPLVQVEQACGLCLRSLAWLM